MNIHTDRLPGARKLRLLEEREGKQKQQQAAREYSANMQTLHAQQPAQQQSNPVPVPIPGEYPLIALTEC